MARRRGKGKGKGQGKTRKERFSARVSLQPVLDEITDLQVVPTALLRGLEQFRLAVNQGVLRRLNNKRNTVFLPRRQQQKKKTPS